MESTDLVPVVVKNPFPPEILAVDPIAMERAVVLVAKAKGYVISDVQSLADAEEGYRLIDALGKSIAESRLEITRPVDDFKKQIMEAERKATIPLLEAKTGLAQKIAKFRAEEQARRDEAARLARIEAERVAAIERKRLQDEQAAHIKKAQEERAAAEAKAKQEAEMFGTEVDISILPEVPVEREVVVIPQQLAVAAPDMGRSAVRQVVKKKLVIDDASRVPDEIAGKPLWILDEKAVDKLLRAGIAVPGCRLVDEASLASAGSR